MFLKVTVSISCFWRSVPFTWFYKDVCFSMCSTYEIFKSQVQYVNVFCLPSWSYLVKLPRIFWGMFINPFSWGYLLCLNTLCENYVWYMGVYIYIYICTLKVYIYIYLYTYTYMYQWYCLVFFGIYQWCLDSHGMAWLTMTIPHIPCFDGTSVFFEVTYWTFSCNQTWVCLNNLCTLW